MVCIRSEKIKTKNLWLYNKIIASIWLNHMNLVSCICAKEMHVILRNSKHDVCAKQNCVQFVEGRKHTCNKLTSDGRNARPPNSITASGRMAATENNSTVSQKVGSGNNILNTPNQFPNHRHECQWITFIRIPSHQIPVESVYQIHTIVEVRDNSL